MISRVLLFIMMFMVQLSHAHHNPDHVVIEIDPSLVPPESNTYLWFIFGPLAILVVIGAIRAIKRYRRDD
ncbi:MAG: hypothetical protein OQL16_14375 [Gammaproteobacteria bacterium]|nr:hypothetical protein [Gammaproteobacteria bacterium]